jgi:hypothetical protein
MVKGYELDKSVPIPTDYRSTDIKYPFDEMEIGDSFFIVPEYEDETVKRVGNRVAQARQSYQKRMARQGTEVKFTQRQWVEEDIAGLRVWRVPAEEEENGES